MPYQLGGICKRCKTFRPWFEVKCERCGGDIERWEEQPLNPPTPEISLPELQPENTDSKMTSEEDGDQNRLKAIIEGTTSVNASDILKDRKACLRIIQALKAGRAPREGIHFLSVGVEEIVERLLQAFRQSSQNKRQTLWLIGDYGEGKSHLLRLIAALAEERRFAWAYVVHDKDQFIGLHKPGWLFQRILWELQWKYPSLKLQYKVMTNPSYFNKRYILPEALKHLITERLRWQGYSGLVICLDELENCCQFHHNQHRPAYETLSQLLSHPLDCPLILCFGLTESGLEQLKRQWSYYVGEVSVQLLDRVSSNALKMPSLSDDYALELAGRIFQLHAAAFNWQPTIEVQEVAQRALELARSNSSGRWRVFVQSVVTQLEVEHQKVHSHQPSTSPTPLPAEPKVQTKPSIPIQPSKLPTLRIGDRVEIIKGPLRGWRGAVESVKDLKAEVILNGLNAMRIWLPLDALKKLR